MDFAVVCLLVGIGALAIGALGSKALKSVHLGKRWIFLIGGILVLVGLILGVLNFIRGWRAAGRDTGMERQQSSICFAYDNQLRPYEFMIAEVEEGRVTRGSV